MIGVFSGRFDPPHIGHILTIMRLLETYLKILVVVLDYSERKACTAEKAKDIFDQVFHGLSKGKVVTVINDVHFSRISKIEYRCLCLDNEIDPDMTMYLSGNHEVIAHFNDIGVPHQFVERTSDSLYSGTKIRKEIDKNNVVLDEFYGVDG